MKESPDSKSNPPVNSRDVIVGNNINNNIQIVPQKMTAIVGQRPTMARVKM
jgi:hypothetical protein